MADETRKVVKFYGYRHPLSNFYKSDFRIGSFIYPTVEHYFQSQKSISHHEKLEIIMADTPKEAKDMGKHVKIKNDWESKRLLYMWKGLGAKFTQNEYLKKYLLDTGDAELIEDSPYDPFWGRGKDRNGKNMMGKMLMELRKELKGEEDQNASQRGTG